LAQTLYVAFDVDGEAILLEEDITEFGEGKSDYVKATTAAYRNERGFLKCSVALNDESLAAVRANYAS
jgi:hypothetical protein